MTMAALLCNTQLELNADVVEFCPVPELATLLAVGTYELVEQLQTRVGRLYLYEVCCQDISRASLKCHDVLEMSGVFDARWKSSTLEPRLAVAAADGGVQILGVDKVAHIPSTLRWR